MTRRRGRPYQPYPARNRQWIARLLVLLVVVGILLAGVAIAFSR
jgi:hypothetical protein